METAQKNGLKKMVETLKDLLEKHFQEKLEKYYGIIRENPYILAIEQLVDYALLEEKPKKEEFLQVREKIISSIRLDEKYLGKWEEAYYWFVDRLVYTFLNRIFALRVMEELGLLKESTIKPEPELGNRSARMARIQEKTPNLSHIEWNIFVLKDAFLEISLEVKILFDETDPSLQIWPSGEIIDKLFEILNGIDPSIYTAPDVIGWFYHYYVLKFRKGHKTMSGHGGKNPSNPYYLSILNTVYTPRWMVEFLVDNALGRWWQDTHQESTLFFEHPFFIKKNPAPPEYSTKKKLDDLKILDPACGSGNFLIYVFQCLMKMYRIEYPNRTIGEIITSILTNNLFGIDINRRPAQLSALALYIIAKKTLKEESPEELVSFQMPAVNIICCDIRFAEDENKTLFLQRISNPEQAKIVKDILTQFNNADEIGTLINAQELQKELQKARPQTSLDQFTKNIPKEVLPKKLVELVDSLVPPSAQNIGVQIFRHQTKNAFSLAQVLMLKYDFIFSNPPFGLLIKSTQEKIKKYYPYSYQDLVSAFIDQAIRLVFDNGYIGMLTDFSFMHLPKFEKFRKNILLTYTYIQYLAITGLGALPDGRNVPALFILRKSTELKNKYFGLFRFIEYSSTKQFLQDVYVQDLLSGISAINCWDEKSPPPERWTKLSQSMFFKLPRSVMDITFGEDFSTLIDFFEKYPPLDIGQIPKDEKTNVNLLHIARCFQGIATGNNFVVTRYWFEVKSEEIRKMEQITNIDEVSSNNNRPFIPFSKGGGDVQFYLNNGFVLWWTKESINEIKKSDYRFLNLNLLGSSDLHWPKSSAKPRSRYNISQKGMINDINSMAIKIIAVDKVDKFTLLGYLNSKLVSIIAQLLTKDRTWQAGITALFPIPIRYLNENSQILNELAKESYELRRDWDTGYPMSPIFAESLVDKILFPNNTINSVGFPKTGHPFCEEYSPCQSDSSKEIIKLTISPEKANIKSILFTLGERFTILTKRLDEIDNLINQILYQLIDQNAKVALEKFYNTIIGTLSYKSEQNLWINDFLMANLLDLIHKTPNGIITLHSQRDEGLYTLFLKLLMKKFYRNAESLQPLLRELEDFLGCSLQEWIADRFFFYHCERFGYRPIVWQFTSRLKTGLQAAVDVFVDYHRLTQDTLSNIRVDYVEPLLAQYQQQQDTGLLPAEKSHFLDELTNFAKAFSELADQGYQTLPSMNILTGTKVAKGKGADQTFKWVAENALEVIKNGYKPDPMKGVLVNLLPLCLEVPNESHWKCICPKGTAKKILKKIGILDQLRNSRGQSEEDEDEETDDS